MDQTLQQRKDLFAWFICLSVGFRTCSFPQSLDGSGWRNEYRNSVGISPALIHLLYGSGRFTGSRVDELGGEETPRVKQAFIGIGLPTTVVCRHEKGNAVKRLVLLVGVPASGKSTLAQRLIDKGYVCLNADAIRKELHGDEGEQSDAEKVFGIFFERLEEALAQSCDIVIDNTNINTKHRSPILQRAIKAGYEDIQLWVLDTPLETCLERNRGRERSLPDEIVSNYYNALHGHGKPRKHEGKLVIVRPGSKDNEFRFFLPR